MLILDITPPKTRKKEKPKRKLSLKILSVLLVTFLVIELLITLLASTPPDKVKATSSWLEGYDYRTSIHVKGSTTTLTNYQVKLTIQGTNKQESNYIDFQKVEDNGKDVRFTDNDKTTKIPYWIQSWKDNKKTATIWIKVPTIPTSGTTIYMYYGKTDATSQSDGDDTFELYNVSGIKAFYHMDETSWNGTTGEVKDETGINHGTAIQGPTTTSSGKLNRAGLFDGFNDYVKVNDSPSLSPDNYTISLFAKKSSTITSERTLLTKGIGDITYRVSVLPGNTIKATVQEATENFQRVTALPLQAGENNLYTAVIDPKGEYAYFGTETNPGKVVKVRLSDFTSDLTRVGALTLETGDGSLWGGVVIDPKGEYAYFGTDTNPPGRVVKVRLSDFTRVGALALESGEEELRSAVIDSKGECAYLGTDTSPGKVVKIRLSDFTRVGAITFEAGENALYSAVIDPKGEYAYFGTETSPGIVVKVRLSDLTRVGTLTLETGENSLDSAVIDPKGEYAYFGTDTSPGRVVKVRLSDFTEAGTLTLQAGEDWLYSAVIDPKGEYAYFSVGGSSGIVVKVRLNDLTTDSVTSTTALSGSFTHVAAVKGSANLKLYVNGTLEDSTPLSISVPTVTDNLMIGSRGQWLSGYGKCSSWFPTTFEGTIDEVTIFNRVLGTDEISALSSGYMEKTGNYFNVRKDTDIEPTFNTKYPWGYKKIFTDVTNRIFADGPIRYSLDPELSDELVNFSVTLSKDSIDLTVFYWLTSDTHYKKWKESSDTKDITTTHVVGALAPNTSYPVKVDGVLFGEYTSNNSGQISFVYDLGYSDKIFEVGEPPDLIPTGNNISSLFYLLPVTFLLIGFTLYFKSHKTGPSLVR